MGRPAMRRDGVVEGAREWVEEMGGPLTLDIGEGVLLVAAIEEDEPARLPTCAVASGKA